MSDRPQDEARLSILASIRASLSASARFDALDREHGSPLPVSVVAPRVDDPVARFREALEAVAGHCVIVRDTREVGDAVREILTRAQARRVVISDSALVAGVVEGLERAGIEVAKAPDRSTLFACDAGVTGAQWGVAETGTLILESEIERHRLASLVPPLHVAIVEAERIRHTLAEVIEAIDGRLSPTVTFVTGPSRTSDIELTLAIGVHGPAELWVVILDTRVSGPHK
jgi:L-lactate dehydrogenase complex protein LldG